MNTVYALVDPITQHVRYIGVTSDPKARISAHIHKKSGTTKCSQWINSLRSQNAVPIFLEIESGVSDREKYSNENFWIHYFLMIGADLCQKIIRHKSDRPDKKFSTKLKEIMDAQAYTQESLAAKTGLSVRTIWTASNGKSVSAVTVRAIAKFFKMKPEQLR